MIVTLTMNPALDKSTSIERLIPEKKMRCASLQTDAGGGGINISKAIKEIGGESIAIFPSGGPNGGLLQQLLDDSRIRYKAVPVQAATRESFMVTEQNTNAQFRFIMPGQKLNEDEIERCITEIYALDETPSFVAASGSLPEGVADDFFARLSLLVKEKGSKLIIDTSGPALIKAVEEGVFMVKPNLTELCTLVNKKYLDFSEIEDAAREVINKGKCEVMVVSIGPKGAMLVTKDELIKVNAPSVKKLSTSGAGDSMIAGIVYMLNQNESMLDAVRFGVACGTAATMNSGTRLFEKEQALKLYEWIKKQ